MITDPRNFYSGFQMDYDNKNLTVLLEETDENLFSTWGRSFDKFNNVNVCLSGGIDSQFVVYVLKQLKKNIKIYIFSWVWEDCVFNSPDVLHAIRFCERHGYEYKNIEINYKVFLESGKFLETCRKYRADSPQIALQIHMLNFIDNDDPTFLGGDTPLLQYDFNKNVASVTGLNYHFYSTTAFLNYAEMNKKIVVKDIFKINPYTQYLSYNLFLDITKSSKLIYPKTKTPVSQYPLRLLMYKHLGAEDFLMKPLLKNTGFEILKMHLAKNSGIYNQYDIQYRFPLIRAVKLEEWYEDFSNLKIKFKNTHLSNILSEYENFCRTNDNLNIIETYNFNL